MSLVTHEVDPLCKMVAEKIWVELSNSLAAIEDNSHLRYYSYTTSLTEDGSIVKDGITYSVNEFVEKEVLPRLGMDINMLPYSGNFISNDDGQKLISISWWVDRDEVWWYIIITS